MNPFVYGLIDPLEPSHIRYVGMTMVNSIRPFAHSRMARRPSTKDSYLINWIRKLHSENRDYSVKILEEFLPEVTIDDVCKSECNHILLYRQLGFKLTNLTEGGEGVVGSLPEVRLKMREAAKNRWAKIEEHRKTSDAVKASITDDTRLKIRTARARQVISHSAKTRQKMCDAWTESRKRSNPLKGKERPNEVKEKIRASNLGHVVTESTRKKISDSAKITSKTRLRNSNGHFI